MHQDCIYTHTNRIMSKVWSHWTVFLVEVTVPIAVVGRRSLGQTRSIDTSHAAH